MPLTCAVDSAAKLLLSKASGIVSYDEIVNHLKAKEQRRALAYAELFDARDARFDLSIPDLHRIANEARRLVDGARSGPVAVVTNNNFVRGLARAYASVTSPDYSAFEIFDDVGDARDWLSQRSDEPVYPPASVSPGAVPVA